MKVLVKKFGGSSLADREKILSVARRIVESARAGFGVVVVASAAGETTSDLLARGREMHDSPPPRELDMLLSVGERISIALLTLAIQADGQDAVSLTGAQAGIVTDGRHGRARILEVRAGRILDELARGRVVVVAGYQGVTREGEVTTLGRGGSDTTAVALAAALGADRCEIWTDVEGVHAAHPGLVPDASLIPALSFEEMFELADNGAKVLKASAVELASRHGVTIDIGSSFSRRLGSTVSTREIGGHRVTGITLEEAIVVLTLARTEPGDHFSLIVALANRGIAVRSIWERGSECGLIIAEDDLNDARELVAQIHGGNPAVGLSVKDHLALLSVVGAGVGFGTDAICRVLELFASMSVRPEHYFCSEMRISFAVERPLATRVLHRMHDLLMKTKMTGSTTLP